MGSWDLEDRILKGSVGDAVQHFGAERHGADLIMLHKNWGLNIPRLIRACRASISSSGSETKFLPEKSTSRIIREAAFKRREIWPFYLASY